MLDKYSSIFLKKSQTTTGNLTNQMVKNQLSVVLTELKNSLSDLTDFRIDESGNIFNIMLFVSDETKAEEVYKKVAHKLLFQQSQQYINAMKNRIELHVSSPRGTEI